MTCSGASRDRQVAKAFFDEGLDLVEARLRLDEVRVGFVEVQQRLRVLAQLEKVAPFFDALDGLFVNGAELVLEKLLFRLEGLAADAVPVLVVVQVDVPGFVHFLPERLNPLPMLWRGRADESVVGAVELFPGNSEGRGHPVDERLRVQALFLCSTFDLEPVLIEPGQKIAGAAAKARVPGDHVRSYGRVCMADVGPIVHVIDRRRHVVRAGHLVAETSQIRGGCQLIVTAARSNEPT
jgi:hypothetical protein